MPARERAAHGQKLLTVLEGIEDQARGAVAERASGGVILVFRSSPQFELQLKSLESSRAGIELLSVREKDGLQQATVFVPAGKLTYFRNQFRRYIGEDTKKGRPKNKKLVESIDEVALAALDQLWTDEADMPPATEAIAWEVWLRTSADAALNFFRTEAAAAGLEVGPRAISFPDRVVVLVRGTAGQLAGSLTLLDVIAELRRAKECPTTFVSLAPSAQPKLVEAILKRVGPPSARAGAVCILDSGVHSEQPLLKAAIRPDDVLTCFPPGSGVDHSGHGTEMAGLALYGDLVDVLGSTAAVDLDHRLESVQILPRVGANHPDVYGAITLEAVSRIGVAAPDRSRVFCLAVTTTDFRDRGQPSSWSAEIDRIAFGDEETPPSLFVVAGGNTDGASRHLYPASNHTEGIHDPGQSWNALTVGACTDKTLITSPNFKDYKPLAGRGGLCPSSSTSLIWQPQWPLKPDLVMEGGNYALAPSGTADCIEDLQLLTTCLQPSGRLFAASGDTSAATALAARMAARIHASYPGYWPETVRALMVHSARWTEAMAGDFADETPKAAVRNRLRCYGFGVPDLGRALWCAGNALTLVSQAELQPYDKPDATVKTKDMHLYRLPWPRAELLALGAEPVTLRITLSYFVEPSPGRRGWKYKHRYASHGLRFDVKKPTESLAQFQARLNKQAEEEDQGTIDGSDSRPWALGSQLRSRGSLLCDWWTGTAADMAECGFIGIYPVTGWWRERPQLDRWGSSVRYSLIASLETPRIDVDLYTPIANQVAIPVTTSR